MAAGSLLALLDDISLLLDDVAALGKVAAKKTAGVLGDDLAVNAEKLLGIRPERELAVVAAVAAGSAVNKLILVPGALLISAFLPWLITPLLVCGGLFLCFEGAEKVLHWRADRSDEARDERIKRLQAEAGDLKQLERKKIRGAIRTDFILSAEIIVLTLGVVESAPFMQQVLVLSLVAGAVTLFVYGLVGAIVKIDDVGLWFVQRHEAGQGTALGLATGRGLLWFAPRLMKALSVVGTAAMFMVGGGILSHAIPVLHHALGQILDGLAWAALLELLVTGIVGMVAGIVLVGLVGIWHRIQATRH